LLLFNDVASRRTGLAQANSSKVSGAESGKAAAKASILHIDCSNFKGVGSQSSSGASHVQTMLQIGQAEGEPSSKVEIPRGAILDVEIWGTFLAVLFEKNLV
jgi:hypothetical protein|tara:strand:+ start:1077 stop:1382 length:306 start_codon:yes stop_codon:yes gene_type:complete